MDRDKRDFYRLPDTILVEHEFVSEHEADNADPSDFFTSDPNFHLLREIYELQLESKELLRSIQQENRHLGRFLANLDQRVEILARGVIQHSTSGSLQDCQAEISEGGVSFICSEHIATGQNLILRLMFQPSMLGLTCFGLVKHCQLVEHDYRIGVEFKHLDVQTQRIISRHIIAKQSEQRRARLHERS